MPTLTKTQKIIPAEFKGNAVPIWYNIHDSLTNSMQVLNGTMSSINGLADVYKQAVEDISSVCEKQMMQTSNLYEVVNLSDTLQKRLK